VSCFQSFDYCKKGFQQNLIILLEKAGFKATLKNQLKLCLNGYKEPKKLVSFEWYIFVEKIIEFPFRRLSCEAKQISPDSMAQKRVTKMKNFLCRSSLLEFRPFKVSICLK
jgi:hypothetical protein